MTAFFVPDALPDEAEARWVGFADLVGAPVVGPADRVLSVRFVHGAEEWTATVGKRLSGQLAARTDRRTPGRTPSSRSAPTREASDTATVQAVLDTGESFVVLTDAPPVGTIRDSTFDNPVTIPRGDARRVLRFGG